MKQSEIEMIVEKANAAYVACIAYRIKAKTLPQVDYLADVYSGKYDACTEILTACGIDLNKCGLFDVEEAIKRAQGSIILEGIADKSFGNF